MTGFYVYDPALRDFSRLLGQSAQDSQQAEQYVQRRCTMDPPTAKGVFSYLEWHHAAVQRAAMGAFTRLTTLLESSGQGMTDAASYYQQTDAALAAQIDATFPEVKRGGTPNYPPARPYPGIRQGIDPPTDLVLPSVPDYVNPLQPLLDAQSILSATNWALKILTEILGYNPLDKAIEFFTGDWEQYGMVSEGWNSLANFTEDLTGNISHGLGVLNEFWGGNAENAAWSYFTGLDQAVGPVAGTFGKLRYYYNMAAYVTFEASQFIAGEIIAMVDLVVAIGLTAAAVLQAGLDPANDAAAVADDGAELAAAAGGGDFIGNLMAVLYALAFFADVTADAVAALEAPTSYPLPGHSYHFPPR